MIKMTAYRMAPNKAQKLKHFPDKLNPISLNLPLIETSKFEWTLDDIRIQRSFWSQFGEVSTLLDVSHCPKLHSCAISKLIINLEKMAKTPILNPTWGPKTFFMDFYQ